ncbi:YdcF family protein [Methylosoma difficile]
MNLFLKSFGGYRLKMGFFWKKIALPIGILSTICVCLLGWKIFSYSSVSSPASADVAVVLGAAVWNGKPSPVFQERINHGITLYRSGRVKYLIFTGGIGNGDDKAESDVARLYASQQGVPMAKILTEHISRITYGNLFEADRIMKAANLQNALIVSDPLHMKRAMKIAEDMGIQAYPSPTPTTRYQGWRTKASSLLYEVFFYIVHIGGKAVGFW